MCNGYFPRCTEADRKAGWDIDTKLLAAISQTTDEMESDFKVSMEGVELVLLALEQFGWNVEPPRRSRSAAP